ncbi:MAG: hypothetical protein WB686_08625, partial [Pseudolabrys sp.]
LGGSYTATPSVSAVTAFARGPNDGMIVLGGPLAQLHRGKFLGPDRQVVATRPRRTGFSSGDPSIIVA